jgi:thymidine kinase
MLRQSEELVRRLRRALIARQRVQVFKPSSPATPPTRW